MFSWKNLDARTRELMEEEVELDIENDSLYLSKRFTELGAAEYAQHLLNAVQSGTEASLTEALRAPGYFMTHERNGNGVAEVPVTAPETFAENEFNRFYCRALCRRAIDDGVEHLVIYRAKAVSAPRRESELRIGRALVPEKLLNDLRTNVGSDTALGVNKPNSGLSVHLPL
ncbi:hypothetical protein HUA74_02610 [Myxococcus sp. CA051A]|uniref:hypothetical protein n=1 Tax=Myxococcus sp. CA051A TaxID=2741739 RepID=UPI00157A4FEA|nr:hypothetical protein [Myxococcus sp. CA051A]NTX59545.1 hypothetical protein [Myxococcus sp. CA051A]